MNIFVINAISKVKVIIINIVINEGKYYGFMGFILKVYGIKVNEKN